MFSEIFRSSEVDYTDSLDDTLFNRLITTLCCPDGYHSCPELDVELLFKELSSFADRVEISNPVLLCLTVTAALRLDHGFNDRLKVIFTKLLEKRTDFCKILGHLCRVCTNEQILTRLTSLLPWNAIPRLQAPTNSIYHEEKYLYFAFIIYGRNKKALQVLNEKQLEDLFLYITKRELPLSAWLRECVSSTINRDCTAGQLFLFPEVPVTNFVQVILVLFSGHRLTILKEYEALLRECFTWCMANEEIGFVMRVRRSLLNEFTFSSWEKVDDIPPIEKVAHNPNWLLVLLPLAPFLNFSGVDFDEVTAEHDSLLWDLFVKKNSFVRDQRLDKFTLGCTQELEGGILNIDKCFALLKLNCAIEEPICAFLDDKERREETPCASALLEEVERRQIPETYRHLFTKDEGEVTDKEVLCPSCGEDLEQLVEDIIIATAPGEEVDCVGD
ncbi:hypothetical protein Ciccas_003711 [Cichlidogyrus casuarinus]|uniref:Uncharacterized protein n=1 Tax=Cichlidogyrus casuarinus TaxID=1844966 RepID=A0ABD2QE03_9PLAT